MAINPSIPLASRNPSIAQALELGREDKRRSELFELGKQDRERRIGLEDDAIAAQEAEAEAKRQRQADEDNLKSIAIGAVEVKPLLDNIESIPRAIQVLQRRIEQIKARGGDPTDSVEVLEMVQAGRIDQARLAVDSAIQAGEAQGFIKGGRPDVQTVASILDREDLLEGFTPEERDQARRIEAGLVARAGTETIRDRFANDPDFAGRVGDAEAGIAEKVEFAKKTGVSRSAAIDDGFAAMETIDGNIRNLEGAIQAIDDGASTGVVVNRFTPTVRESTIRLNQLQGELGLDVVGAVTFGALSQGELNLALDVALPTDLQPPELKQWIQNKIAAQTKLRDYYEEQIDFLDQGGTIAGFVRKRKRDSEQNQPSPEEAFQAEWDAAPSGAVLQAPDGTMRRKP